jgi:GNAT superfamily N-acetyltransferase
MAYQKHMRPGCASSIQNPIFTATRQGKISIQSRLLEFIDKKKISMQTNPALHFRRATVADVATMARIRLEVKENPLSNPDLVTLQMYIDYLDALGRGWVCEKNKEIIGFSYAAKLDSSIWALFVSPGQEGLGAGQGLLKLATDYLFALGNEEIKLGTAANTRADRFYTAQGWKRGEMKNAVEVSYTLNKPDR